MSINDLLESIVNKFQIIMEHKKYELVIDIINDVGMIRCDKKAVQQTVLNILENAYKYSLDKNKIPWIKLSARTKKNQLLISIHDKGIGMEKKYLSKIFKHFYRIENIDGILSKGTGLGLAIVKFFILKHKGKIIVQSSFKTGSRFDIYLPLK